jgi:LAO/AO transport system kinase
MLDALEKQAPFPGAPRVGLTGAPGSGKSTLLDALVREIRPRGETVAIVAIDPSSRNTGGALLGDRIRVRSAASDPGVFIRSMAARDQLGGLSESTWAAVAILSACFDWVFIETVGVGQSESEISSLVDVLVYVATPGAGDSLQFMKAGILEYPDIFIVNKADLGAAASRTATELQGGVSLGQRGASAEKPKVVLISARDRTGVDELIECIDAHIGQQSNCDGLRARRKDGRTSQILRVLERRYGTFGIERIGGRQVLLDRVGKADDTSAFLLLSQLSQQIESALGRNQ